MKKILPLLFLANCASLMPRESRTVRNVVEAKGVKADQAYDRATMWFAKSFNNANWAIQIKDKEKKQIVANITLSCPKLAMGMEIGANNMVSATLDFMAKDNKYRVTFEDIQWEWVGSPKYTRGPSDAADLAKIDTECLALLRDDLTQALNGAKTIDDKF